MKHSPGYPGSLVVMTLISISLLVLPSCKKDKDRSVIEIPEARTAGNVKVVPLEFLPGGQTVTVITLKNSGSDKSVHIKLAVDTVGVAKAGAKVLPGNGYTAPTLEYDVPPNGTVNVPVTFNRTNLSVDTLYGFGFRIESVSSGNVAADANKVILKIDLRNRWDGRYRVTGTLTDVVAPTIGFTEQEIAVITTSPTQVKWIPKDLGIPGYLILSGTSLSYYGSFGPILNINPADNKITTVTNYYGQPAVDTRSAQIDPSGTNQWDPGSKSIVVKFWMNQPSVVPAAPYHRVLFVNTLIYLGPRY